MGTGSTWSVAPTVIKTYFTGFPLRWLGRMQRDRAERMLLPLGYRVVAEEQIREFSGGVGAHKKVKVTYSNQ